jgi:hypothetical protein
MAPSWNGSNWQASNWQAGNWTGNAGPLVGWNESNWHRSNWFNQNWWTTQNVDIDEPLAPEPQETIVNRRSGGGWYSGEDDWLSPVVKNDDEELAFLIPLMMKVIIDGNSR